MRIGWIGLGSIGTEMVRRALAAGHEVRVYARGKGLADAKAAGAEPCTDYRLLAEQCEILGICVYDEQQVREVLFDHGTLAGLQPGTLLIVHTTASPQLVTALADAVPAGVSVLDATFSGGPGDVAAGNLTLMVGGQPHSLERARPLLESYCGRVHHLGPVGHGQRFKLLNNLLFASNLHHTAAILDLGAELGLDAAHCARVLQDCSASSYAMGLFATAAPAAAVMRRARPYLVKDVATALSTLTASGVETQAFAATAVYFKSDG